MEQRSIKKYKNKTISFINRLTPKIKVIISNCSPTIPSVIIEQHLKEAGLKVISPIYHLKIGMQEKYSHIA